MPSVATPSQPAPLTAGSISGSASGVKAPAVLAALKSVSVDDARSAPTTTTAAAPATVAATPALAKTASKEPSISAAIAPKLSAPEPSKESSGVNAPVANLLTGESPNLITGQGSETVVLKAVTLPATISSLLETSSTTADLAVDNTPQDLPRFAPAMLGGTRPSAVGFPGTSLYMNLQLRLRSLFRIVDGIFAMLFSLVSPPWIYVWLAAYLLNESHRT